MLTAAVARYSGLWLLRDTVPGVTLTTLAHPGLNAAAATRLVDAFILQNSQATTPQIYFALTGLRSCFSIISRGVAPGYYISRLPVKTWFCSAEYIPFGTGEVNSRYDFHSSSSSLGVEDK